LVSSFILYCSFIEPTLFSTSLGKLGPVCDQSVTMNILITGASGLIGTALVGRLREHGHFIVCQSRNFHEDEPGVKWVKHDLIEDSWSRLSLPEMDEVYHLAGQTSTYSAKQDPFADLAANVLGLLTLLEHFRKQERPPFVVLTGTATEVGLTNQLPINESLPDQPITFYDISKLTAEMYLKQYVRDGLVNGCTLRLSNVFGRSQPGQQRDRGILDKIFNRAISGHNITIYGDGNYLRDYIFIDDVISALVLAASHREQTNGRAFYVGSGQGIALKDAFLKVASMAAKVTGIYVDHEYVKPPAGLSDIEYRSAVIDSSAFRQATGWVPQYDFDAGLEAAYHEFLLKPTVDATSR